MQTPIEEIVRKLHSLPEAKILEVLDFVEFLAWNKRSFSSQQLENDPIEEDDKFEAIADHLADIFQTQVGTTVPLLSDYAVSRAGIYEEYP